MKNTSKSISKTKMKKEPPNGKLRETLILEKLPGVFLLACLLVALGFLFYVIWPFVTVIFVGGVLTIAFYPVYRKILKLFRGYRKLSAVAALFLVILVILIPLTLFVSLLAVEANNTYELIKLKVESGVFDEYLKWNSGGYFYDLKVQLESVINFDNLDLKANILSWSKNVSGFLVDQTKNIAVGVSSFILSMVVMLFTMYYFFKDGDELVEKVGSLSPLPYVYEEQLFKKIASMVKAVVFGVFLTSIIQGVVGGIGFAIAGISNPVFWATAIAFFSLMPVVGTAVIWVPASIILVILGDYGNALFIFIWGFAAIGSVDNLLRPYLIGGKARTYPLMTFLVILGGVLTMGLKGVLVGPLILIVLMSFIHIYEAEYSRVLKK
jgi:predicted PurR-regulated permease PerM